MNNPHYPHHCKIYRIAECDSFSNGEIIVIYDGVCRKQSSSNIRTFKTGQSNIGQVVYGDYRVSIPVVLSNLKSGDKMDVTDAIGTDVAVEVIYPATSDMFGGCTKMFYNKVNI